MGKVILLIALVVVALAIYKGWLPGRGALAPQDIGRAAWEAESPPKKDDWVYKQNTCSIARANVRQLEQAEKSGGDVWSLHGDQKKLSRAEIYAALDENRRLVAANCNR